MSKVPTEPGYYWMRRQGEGWIPCEVDDRSWGGDERYVVTPFGRDWVMLESELDGVEFGDKLLPPGNSWAAIVEELCSENARLWASEANACARECILAKEKQAAEQGVSLTLKSIVLALGGQPSEETNLVWILKRIEELRK